VLSAVLGLYLLNKIRLTVEDDDKHISVGRLLIAVFFLAFSLYLIPGLWGSPLKPLSGFLPNYSEFSLGSLQQNNSSSGRRMMPPPIVRHKRMKPILQKNMRIFLKHHSV